MSPQSTPRDPDLEALRRDHDALTQEAAQTSPHPDEETWIRLASDELQTDERERLLDHAMSCTECTAVYRAVAHVRRGASPFDAAAPRAQPAARLNTRSSIALALAAGVVIAVGAAIALRSGAVRDPAPVNRVDSQVPAPPPSPARIEPRAWALGNAAPDVRLAASSMALRVRGADTERNEVLRAFGDAIAPYRQGLYADAARALAPLAAQRPEVPEIAFYLGVSRLLSGDAAGALQPLRAARDSTVLSNEARWYEAIAIERTGRPRDADAALGRLCDSPGPYQRRACAILRNGQ